MAEEKKVVAPVEGNATPASPAADNEGNEVEKKDVSVNSAGNDLEELTYKERYASSTREAQRLMEENKQLKEKLGLSEKPEEKKETDTKTEDAEVTDEETPTEKEEAAETPEADKEEVKEENQPETVEPPIVSKNVDSQTAFELAWDAIAEKSPRLNLKEVANKVAIEIARFSKDPEGNPVSYKKAIADAYRFVDSDHMVKSAASHARDEGIVAAAKAKAGILPEGGSKTPASSNPQITPEEREVALKLGMTEHDYLANKDEE